MNLSTLMTTSPAKPAVGGISDYDLPMLNTNIRLRVTWLKQLKTQALIRTAAGQHCDVSTLVREALALWADENDVNLNALI